MEHRLLNAKIRLYNQLKQQKYLIDQRLASLNSEIKEGLLSGTQATDREDILYYGAPGFKVKLTHRKKRANLDEGHIEQFLTEKGLLSRYVRDRVDLDYIEEGRINGEITDAELAYLGWWVEDIALEVERTQDV